MLSVLCTGSVTCCSTLSASGHLGTRSIVAAVKGWKRCCVPCSVLLQVRLKDCHSAQARAEKLSQLEASVAASLGIAMLYAVPDVSLLPEYLELLHALAHVGKAPPSALHTVAVYLAVCKRQAAWLCWQACHAEHAANIYH